MARAQRRWGWLIAGLAGIALAACHGRRGPAAVDAERMAAAATNGADWPSYGRTYDEQRFSPLDKINAANVGRLGLAWSAQLATNRGVEATPVVVDGTLYTTSAWSVAYAFEGKTGKLLWTYDPKVPREVGHNACCDVVNRGVAVWNGRVYLATLDGRLVALDARTGQPVWSVVTVDQAKPYTITMAPRVVHGLVMIGNSGSEYGVRGYVSAYEADTGRLKWRFYTVPGDPSKGFENEAMKAAARTWTGDWWKYGGGGTPWDAMAYDPETNLLYFGTGNGLPWDEKARSPSGGDNLYLSSILAVDADTGRYRWHYQTTPHDSWDFDAAQSLVLADATIAGRPRKVIMQANKNGFFYVLDRTTGKLISARNYTPVTWAKGIDPATGRPIEMGDVHYRNGPATILPSGFGAHNWHPMAFSPQTGLVYIPAQEVPGAYGTDAQFIFTPGEWNTALNTDLNTLPVDPKARAAMRNSLKGYLIAWDPVRQKEVWRAPHVGPWNGGVLATGGGLVFQGTADGHFNAYDARSGRQLWSTNTNAATLAGPSTYTIDGEQYVAVGAGFGSAFYLTGGFAAPIEGTPENGRLLVYKLGGKAALPKPALTPLAFPKPPPVTADAQTVALGHSKYNRYCLVCHGYDAISGGVIPDLRRSAVVADPQAYTSVVLQGAYKSQGMVSFADVLDAKTAEAVRQYLLHEANLAYAAQQASGPQPPGGPPR